MTRAIENVVRSIIETETGFTRLILDISSCDYISSEGLGAIVSLWKTHQNTFVIVISPEDDSSIADLFEMTGLSRVLKGAVYVSLEEALAVG